MPDILLLQLLIGVNVGDVCSWWVGIKLVSFPDRSSALGLVGSGTETRLDIKLRCSVHVYQLGYRGFQKRSAHAHKIKPSFCYTPCILVMLSVLTSG